jgi:c-di-GMP-binding flagellar brake protein YcgR
MGPITVTGQVRSMRRRSVEGRNRTYIVGIQYTKLERSDQDRVVRSIFKYELEKARKASGL